MKVLTLLGTQYIGNFEYTKEVKNWNVYLKLMIDLFEHPSPLLNYYVTPFLYSLLSNVGIFERSKVSI